MTTLVGKTVHATVAPAPAELALLMKHGEVDKDAAAELLRRRQMLPEGWMACRTADGDLYYHNSEIGASQWEHPRRLFDHPQISPAVAVASLASIRKAKSEAASKAETDSSRKDGHDTPPTTQHSVYDATSRHVDLPTPQTLFSDSTAIIQREDLQEQAFALHGLLTEAESAAYVASAEAVGFHDSDVGREFPERIRNNSRLIHFSKALSAALWRRLAPQLAHRDIFLMQPMGFGAEGRWKPVGVNPCFRISQYQTGEQFAAHHDGMYVNDDGECSIYSLVLYLNENFEGGELELPQETLFRPRCGSAVFFPHDTLHAGRAVMRGTKYVARSELMFRCVESAPAPREPSFLNDPLWQKMAALYEHVGDLAAQGNPRMTTEAYQEALGIQIAHQGTKAIASPMSPLPLPVTGIAHAMSFLHAAEVLALLPISRAWQEASKMGWCWRIQFKRRWPGSSEVLADAVFGIDAEVRDWFGMYRGACLHESGGNACIIFVDAHVKAQKQGHDPIPSVPAKTLHHDTGAGWDRSLKQRSGWRVGSTHARTSWIADGTVGDEVNWVIFPEILGWAFEQLKVRPPDHRIVLPAVPGIMGKAFRARVARILTRRFEVSRVHIPPAPLCALLAHGLSTGAVVWASSVGACRVFCYQDAKEAGTFGNFSFSSGQAQEIVDILERAMEVLASTDGGIILRHIVFSVQEQAAPNQIFPQRNSVDAEERKEPWLCTAFDEVQSLVQQRSRMAGCMLLRPIPDDVLKGASVLTSTPHQLRAHEVAPEEEGCWEWRLQLVDGRWYQLPKYVVGVLEGALRDGETDANVRLCGHIFLLANLADFTVALARFNLIRSRGKRNPETFTPIGASCKLTRFLRGRPSLTPDRRKPEELKRVPCEDIEVTLVEGTEALHVRTLAGKLVLSLASRGDAELCARDLLKSLADRLGCAPAQLSFLRGAEQLDLDQALQPLFPEDWALELLVLVGQPAPAVSSQTDEVVPEDVPGDCKSADFMQFVEAVREITRATF